MSNRHIDRDAKTGRIVTEQYARKNPDTTVREAVEIAEPAKRLRFSLTFEVRVPAEARQYVHKALEIVKILLGSDLKAITVQELPVKAE